MIKLTVIPISVNMPVHPAREHATQQDTRVDMYLIGDKATTHESMHALMDGRLNIGCGIIVMPYRHTMVECRHKMK